MLKILKELLEDPASRERILKLASDLGFDTDNDLDLLEALSTQAMRAVIYTIAKWDGSLDDVYLDRTALYEKFDGILNSGGTRIFVENKLRDKDYDVPKISPRKIEKIKSLGGWIIIECWDTGRYYIFDLSEYEPKYEDESWYKEKVTACPGHKETEGAYLFDTKEALISGKLPKRWLFKDFNLNGNN